MKYLVDANVLSEATRQVPNATVVEWLEAHEPELVIDAIVLSEIAVGVAGLPKGRKRTTLEAWFGTLVDTVECLPWDAKTSREWAQLVVHLRRQGQVMPLFDSMIAATARARGLIVVTRNVRDFEPAGVEILNPFANGGQAGRVHEPGGEYGAR